MALIPGAADDADMLLIYLVRAMVEAEAHLAGDADAAARLDAFEEAIAGLTAGHEGGPLAARFVRRPGTHPGGAHRGAATPTRMPGGGAAALREPRRRLVLGVRAAGPAGRGPGPRRGARRRPARSWPRRTAPRPDLGAAPLREELERLASRSRIPLAGSRLRAPPTPASGLTARELEVLALLADGRTNREIGESLFISPKTASVHVSNLLMKLGVANRTEAASRARERGLLTQA